MTSVLGRTYVVAGSLLVFLVLWAGIAARPWAASTPDVRLAALDRREQRIRRDAAAAEALVARRFDAYRAELAARKAAATAPAPRVRVVTLPPLTSTRTS